MSPAEVTWRARDRARQVAWSGRQVKPGQAAAGISPAAGDRCFTRVLPPGTAERVPAAARDALVRAADQLLAGEWEVLGVTRTDMVQPDWFRDPVTGRRSPQDRYAFRINHRSEEQTGNVKQVWEISRLQHLTLLASAWYVTGDKQYASRVAEQLRSWFKANPFLSGVHWTSGIEIGIRLISLAWIRRLLNDWPDVAGLFEHDPLAVQQIYWHQRYLSAFRSRGSSANNHVIAEAAGQLVASCAFPWFGPSGRWRRESARLLERELINNTFPSGVGRELAADYQCFVAELGLLAAVEAAGGDRPLAPAAWDRLCAMVDSCAALVDEQLRPPRQGDSDEGRALLLDAPVANRWPSLLALGEGLFGRQTWWPRTVPDVSAVVIGTLAVTGPRGAGTRPARAAGERPPARPDRFADAGIALLRTIGESRPEIWCRCDGGPHGFLSIAAHAHADALSVEVRYGGADILADPGTYCYHGDREWRSYFRSTIAHNTVEIGGRNQSAEGGPFLWLRHANARETEFTDEGNVVTWAAEHDGYAALRPHAQHRRRVRLDRAGRSIAITDEISGGHDVRVALHLGPGVMAELEGTSASLRWAGGGGGTPGDGTAGQGRLELPGQLSWRLHRGETSPILGWYSSGLGRRVPAGTLIGCGRPGAGVPLTTRLSFHARGQRGEPDSKGWAVS
jgi:hypothetical protein